MMEAPTLSRFLLRSRMLWLTILCLMFFSWAWWDSHLYRTHISVLLGNSLEFYLWTGHGGFTMGLGEIDPFHPGTAYFFHRESTAPVGNLMKKFTCTEPVDRFSNILLLTLILSFLWHAWRWRVIRNHFQAPSQSNGLS